MERAARWVTGVTLVYLLVVLAVALAPARGLGHDEAVYAVGARGMLHGDAADHLPMHRSIGMKVLAAPGVVAGGGELAIRAPFALLACVYLAVVWVIARRWFGAGAAALAVAVQATMAPWQWRAAEALSDVPSALALLGMLALCLRADEGGGAADAHRRAWARAVAAGVLGAAACYVRYASAPAVAAIAMVTLLDDPRRWRWLALAGVAGLAAITPFFVWSASETGSILGVLDEGERMARRAYPGEGLVYYATTWPWKLAGPVAGVVAAIGVVVGLAGWRAGWRDATPAQRARRMIVAAGLGQLLALGWRVHGETRFVFFAMTCFAIAGVSWIAGEARRWKVAVVVVALAAVPSALWTWRWLDRLAERRVPVREAAAAIVRDRGGERCVAFSTEVPMVVWYAGCHTWQVDGWGLPVRLAVGAPKIYLNEARGLPRSIGGVEAETRAALGWTPVACADPARWCVWRATR